VATLFFYAELLTAVISVTQSPASSAPALGDTVPVSKETRLRFLLARSKISTVAVIPIYQWLGTKGGKQA
jgi:hypothetical protein